MSLPIQTSQTHPHYTRCWFVICFLSRCGSSHLVSLLNSHKNIECYSEEFAPDPHDETKRTLHLTPERALQRIHNIYVEHPLSSHAAGFKFKYPVQFGLYPEIHDYLLQHKEHLKIIQLTRKNSLKRYVSNINAKNLFSKEGKWNAFQHISATPLHIDIEECKRYMENYEQNVKQLDTAIKIFPNKLSITYEDLFENPTETLRTILTFLGVSTDENLSSQVHKYTTDDLAKAVSNIEEVQAALYGTKWQVFLPKSAPIKK
ncbi:MAG: sulfotransferase [Kiritimatiellales bacterium]|nr:sulfotransferase [Kiritimatiellales bacterium]